MKSTYLPTTLCCNYHIIKSQADFDQLQQDINCVSSCISEKYLQFSAGSCSFHEREFILYLLPVCYLMDTSLRVNEYKYLGITITSNMSWSPHITNVCNKTRRQIGLLYRRFYQNSCSNTLLKLYQRFIRPHQEYSAVVWNPHLKGDIEALEKIQKYALRVCFKSWDLNYEDLLSVASLPSLHERRMQASLCHLFKIINGLTDFPGAPVTKRQFHYCSRTSSSSALSIPHFRTTSYQHSFFPLAVSCWNKLPSEILECDSFKCCLSMYSILLTNFLN